MKASLFTVVVIISFFQQSAIAENSSMVEMLYKFDGLQKEVGMLRGQVEEMQHELEKLKQKQREQYLDVDRRLLQQSKGTTAVEPVSLPSNVIVPEMTIEEPSQLTQQASIQPDIVTSNSEPMLSPETIDHPIQPVNERQAYELAFSLITEKKYKQAEQKLTRFVQEYPDGNFTANAHYWLGEMQLLSPNLPAAKASFEQVVSQFPTHHKVPDAMYKLGVTLYQLDEKRQATKMLNKVVDQFPGTSAANLAKQYLQDFN